MRPLTLTLDGFRSYAAATEIDWRDRRLVGIVGPIGSGKSSILDGICFALYGKTPGERSNIRSLIHQRSDVAKVELVFAVDGRVWKAVRAIRRKGQSQHALYRLDEDGEHIQETLGKAEVDAEVVELLGLDFDAFNRSVLLAQGRFAEFLAATPTDRDKVLKGVFGFDRLDKMEALAKERRNGAVRDLEELGRRKADLDIHKQAIAEVEQNLVKARTRRDALDGIGDALAVTVEEQAKATAQLAAANRRTDELAALAERLPPAQSTRDLLTTLATARADVDDLRAAHLELEARAEQLAQERQEMVATVGGDEGLAEARALAGRRADAAGLVEREAARLAEADERARQASEHEAREATGRTEAADRSSAAQAAAEVAAARLVDARRRLEEATHADMASALRAGVSRDDPCPVCLRPIDELPVESPEAAEHLAAAEQAHAQQAAAAAEADAAVAAATAEEAAAHARLEAAGERTKAAEQQRNEAEKAAREAREALDRLEARLAELLGQDETLAAFDDRLADLERRRQEVRDSLADAQQALAAAEQKREAARVDAVALSRQVASIAGRLDVDVESMLGADDVAGALEAVRTAWIEAQQTATDERDTAVRQAAESAERRAVLLESVGLTPDDDHTRARSDANAACASLEKELEVRREAIAASADLEERAASLEAERDLYDQLAKDLRPSAFLGYLLDEERAELASVGSARFEELSGGRYRFTDDGSFDIVDLAAAEQVRRADTLSGGETFLASLALALALAEMIARGRGRLDAFFLDEGFGSLDAEHLELAMAGIERLVADHDDRLVVIVSHVAEMRQRIEDLIALDKDPVTGVTLVR